MLVTILISCQSSAQKKGDGLSSQTKHFKNLQASIIYPENFQEIEADYSYTFIDSKNDYVYIVSIYVDNNLNQVSQTIKNNLSQNGFVIKLKNDFSKNPNGLTSADASVEYSGNTFPGHLIMEEYGKNTYLFFGCVTNEQLFSKQKNNLEQMAISLQTDMTIQKDEKKTVVYNDNTSSKSVQEYQNLLMNKVLLNSKRSRDIISTDDNTQSHGKWIASEDVNKTRRFTLCGGGFGYFRFVSTGRQITGDDGTFELDKHSGMWKVLSDAGKIGIYMEDERNGKRRFFEINEYKNNIIIIDNLPYEILTQEQSGNECMQADGKVVVPG